MLFCSAGAVFCAGRQRRCCGSAICASGVVVLRCFAWNARATVCSSVIVVGPDVQAVCFQFSECGARCCVIVRASHVAGVCAVLGGLS